MGNRVSLSAALVICISVFTGGSLFAQGTQTDSEAPPMVKCGRDCLHHVCQTFGVDADLKDIDRALGLRRVVSIADLRQVANSLHLHCRSVWLNPKNADRISDAIAEDSGRRAAIIALPTKDAAVRHFVVLQGIDADQLSVWDVGLARTVKLSLRELIQKSGIPLLWVVVEQSDLTAIDQAAGFTLWNVVHSLPLSFSLVVILAWQLLAVLGISLPSWKGPFRTRLQGHSPKRIAIIGLAVCLSLLIVAGLGYIYAVETAPLVYEPAVNLGSKPAGSVQVANLEIKNQSWWQACKIDSLRTSCNCIAAEVVNGKMPPGGSAVVRIRVHIPTGKGTQAVLVKPDRSLPEFTVKVQYQGYEATRLEPAYFNFGGLPKGVTATKDFSVRVADFEGEPIAVHVSDETKMVDGLNVKVVGSGQLGPDREITLRISSSGKRPLGTFLQYIVLATKESSPRSFLLAAHGEIVRPIWTSPESVLLRPGPDGQMSSQTIEIKSRVGGLSVSDIRSTCDSISVTSMPSSEGDPPRFVVQYNTGKVAADARVHITIDKPLKCEIDVPVHAVSSEMP